MCEQHMCQHKSLRIPTHPFVVFQHSRPIIPADNGTVSFYDSDVHQMAAVELLKDGVGCSGSQHHFSQVRRLFFYFFYFASAYVVQVSILSLYSHLSVNIKSICSLIRHLNRVQQHLVAVRRAAAQHTTDLRPEDVKAAVGGDSLGHAQSFPRVHDAQDGSTPEHRQP